MVEYFFPKYQRVSREKLPEQVKIIRTYVRKIGPRQKRMRRIGPRNQRRRRQQIGRGLGLSTATDLGRRAAGSKLSKMMINYIDYITIAYKKKLKTK